MKQIPLSNGMATLVDDDVYEWASRFKWHVCKSREGLLYVIRHIRKPGGKRTTSRLHREIMGAEKDESVDHRNGYTLDNQRANLRRCHQRLNAANSRKPAGTTSRFKGVYWNREKMRWQAQICINRITRNLGRFDDEEAAAIAYDQAAVAAFGPFARVNFPERVGHDQRAAC